MKSSLVWYSIPRIMANFLWYYICFPFSLSWSSIFLCNIPQPGVRCPMRLVSVRYYLLAFNIKFFILNIFKYLIVFIYSPTFLHLRIFQPYQVSEPGCVCQILFHSFQYSFQYSIFLYSIFYYLIFFILSPVCLNWAESVRYSGWCWQRAQYDLLSKLSIVFFYFRYFPKLSSKFLCGILSLSTSCLIMEKSAMRFQNIFVGEPKYGCKIFFGAILNRKVVGPIYSFLFCHVLKGYW